MTMANHSTLNKKSNLQVSEDIGWALLYHTPKQSDKG